MLERLFFAVLANAAVATAAMAQLVTPVIPTPDDYPAFVANNNWGGRVRLRLVANPDGSLASCEVTQSSGIGLLDDRSCQLYRARARFVASSAGRTYVTNLVWSVPDPVAYEPLDFLRLPPEYAGLRLGREVPTSVLLHQRESLEACVAGARGSSECSVTPTLGLPGGMTQGAVLQLSPALRVEAVGLMVGSGRVDDVQTFLRFLLGKPCMDQVTNGVHLYAWVSGSTYVTMSPTRIAVFAPDMVPPAVLEPARAACPALPV